MGKIEVKKLLRRLSPYTMKKGILYLRHYGLREFWIRLHERFEPEEIPYGPWYEAYRPGEEALREQRKKRFAHPVVFSICVPVYHPPARYLSAMIESVLAQTYPHWELCLVQADASHQESQEVLTRFAGKDPRIRVKTLSANLGIAGNTNEALAMAKGDWLGFLDHDDVLAPEALYSIARALEKHPKARMVYTDEDKLSPEGEHFQPHFKPDFNLDLLRSNNYICHFLLVQRSLCEEAGPVSSAFDGAQDYDFILRCAEAAMGGEVKAGADPGFTGILHVPEVLYHWRTHAASTADNPVSKAYAFEAGQRAIEAHLARLGVPGTVRQTADLGFYEVFYAVPEEEPLVSILIPNKDHVSLLRECLTSLEKSTYGRIEVWIAENNSEEEETFAYYKELEEKGLRGGSIPVEIDTWQGAFNYAAINNQAARRARGEYLVFLNNDIVIESPDWLQEFVSVCARPEVGAAGARLCYPDGTIQHAGIVVGMGGIAGAMFVGMDGRRTGYLHKASLKQDMSAVTAACMMARRDVFWEAGGFTEKLAVAFNDVDLCLKIRQRGYLIVYCPQVQHIHAESKTRGPEDTKEKVRRFQGEIEYMRSRWIRILREGDPCYNKNLSLTKWNYSLRPMEETGGGEQHAGGVGRDTKL